MQKCRGDNQAAQEERRVVEQRKQALEETKARRKEADETAEAEGAVLDALIEKLRNGDVVRRRNKQRLSDKSSPAVDGPVSPGNETAVMALDMLTRLQNDGFIVPPSPTVNALSQKRRKRRTERASGRETPTSPLSLEVFGELAENSQDPEQEGSESNFLQ